MAISNLVDGSITLFLCMICLIPYTIVLRAMISNKTFIKHYSYKIMVQLGIFDMGELMVYLVLSLMKITNSNFGYVFTKIIEAISNATWVGEGTMILILAINRFLTLLDIKLTHFISEKKFYYTLFILAWLWVVAQIIQGCLPDLGAIIYLDRIVFENGTALVTPYEIYQIRSYYIMGVLVLTGCLYIMIVLYLIVLRRFKTSNTKIIEPHEFRLFFQAMFICFYKALIVTTFSFFLPQDPILYFMVACISLLESGYNPYMYFIFNRTLRKAVIKSLGCGAIKKSTNRTITNTNNKIVISPAWQD